MCASADVVWGHFQSLIQISIALNAVYFSISEFLDPLARKERALTSDAIEEALSLEPQESYRDIVSDLHGVRDELTALYMRDDKVLAYIRVFSVVFFVTGLVMLAFSSFYSNKEIDLFWKIVCSVLNLPVVSSILYFVAVSYLSYAPLTRHRRRLVERMATVEHKGGE